MKAIPLTKGFATIVDDQDYDLLCKFKWQANVKADGNVYAVRSVRRKTIYMHRFLTNPTPDEYVDHANFDTLDNRRANLRRCTPAQSFRHTRGHRKRRFLYKGITAFRHGKYRARFKSAELGTFNTQEEAARAYDKEARARDGTFAVLNFPAGG